MKSFYDTSHLIDTKQFGFSYSVPEADLLLNLFPAYNKNTYRRQETFFIALEIDGGFARVWHHSLLV